MADTEIPVKEVTIAGYSFNVPQPYAEGHTLTAGEARAMNQIFVESIRNNMAKVVTAAHESPTAEVNLGNIATLVYNFAENYEFSATATRGGRPPVDPVEAMALRVARTTFTEALRKRGVTVKAAREKFGDDAIDLRIQEIANLPDTIKEAKRRCEAREKNATSALDGLDL